MPEVIRLHIKPYPYHISALRSSPSLVQGHVSWPEWRDGQERELDLEIYQALQDCGISTYRTFIAHEFEHDTGAGGLHAWEIVVELAGAVSAGAAGGLATLLVQQVLPRFIKIFRPRPPRDDQEAVTLTEARERAVRELRSALTFAGTENAGIRETLSTAVDDSHYVFNFQVGDESHTVLVATNGSALFMMKQPQ